MTLIDGDKIITAQLYDDEHEEFTEKKMSIIDFVNAYSDEGVTTADYVLDKIREEIEQASYEYYFEYGEYIGEDTRKTRIINTNKVLQIIDKYKTEREKS